MPAFAGFLPDVGIAALRCEKLSLAIGNRRSGWQALRSNFRSEDFNQAEALADDMQRRFPEDTWVRFHYVPAVRMTLHPGDDAATEFRKILDQPGLVATDPIGALARPQLGRAYVQSGDVIRAKAANTDFLNSWKGVDQELSILQQAQVESSNAPECDKSPSHSLTRD